MFSLILTEKTPPDLIPLLLERRGLGRPGLGRRFERGFQFLGGHLLLRGARAYLCDPPEGALCGLLPEPRFDLTQFI